MISAMIASAIYVSPVRWYSWREMPKQIGVVAGPVGDERLLVMIPSDGCQAGMRVYSGKYGELDKSMELIARSRVCK